MNSHQRWTSLAVCIALTAISWFVFGQTLGHGFINLDDPAYVVKNPHVVRGLTRSGIVWAFTHIHASNWHPVTWISHMLDCQLYGINPWGHHLTNLCLHTATAIGLFLILQRLTAALWPSAFVAAIFAFHPLRVESVAWISERKDVLSALFFVLTVGAYLRYARAASPFGRYSLVILLFGIGLLCKPMLVTTPFILFLLDYWPLRRLAPAAESRTTDMVTLSRLIFEKLPLIALSIAVCVVTIVGQRVSAQPLMKLPLSVRLGNAALSYVTYIRDTFWPSNLAPLYPFDPTAVRLGTVLLALLLLSGVSAFVWVLRERRYLVTGWVWYLIMLVPVIGILQAGEQARADRYTYLPQIGLAIMVTWGVADLCQRSRLARFIAAGGSALILTLLALFARSQTLHWRDSETLWRYTLLHTRNNGFAHRYLGQALYAAGRQDEAIVEFQQSLQIDERKDMAHVNLGLTLLESGRTEDAIRHFETALLLNPNCSDAHANLGMVMLELGRPQDSLEHLEKALQIEPDFATAHYNLGNTLLRMGRVNEAISHYRAAIDLDPADLAALNNMAWILATWPEQSARDGAKAVESAERADGMARGSEPLIKATLAAAYAECGRFDDAVKAAQSASELALSRGNRQLAAAIQAQMKSYLAGAPIRNAPPGSTPRGD